MSSAGAAPRAAVPSSNARAEASRRNGARSRGPKTEAGKARSARNAIRHGLRAGRFLVVPEEDALEFDGLETVLLEELAPANALQAVLTRRVVSAAWRLARADRIEAEVLAEQRHRDGGLGLAVIRDGNGARAFPTLPRYRGAALAEFMRALKTLRALQAEAATPVRAAGAGPAPVLKLEPRGRAGTAPDRAATPPAVAREKNPNEPEARGKPAVSEPAPPADGPEPSPAGRTRLRPDEPELPAASLAHLQRDLDEAMRVAERGGMRLHQRDAHPEYAQLALAQRDRGKRA